MCSTHPDIGMTVRDLKSPGDPSGDPSRSFFVPKAKAAKNDKKKPEKDTLKGWARIPGASFFVFRGLPSCPTADGHSMSWCWPFPFQKAYCGL